VPIDVVLDAVRPTTNRFIDVMGTHTNNPQGYAYGAVKERSPVSLTELDRLKSTVGLTRDDERCLRDAAETFQCQAESLADAWRSVIASQPHLAFYSARPDGSVDPKYAAASRTRLVRWIVDICTRAYDQAWLDYQHEIGQRHTHTKKNLTDGAESPEHIPMRYLLAFLPNVLESAREMLVRVGYRGVQLEATHAAWYRAVILHVTLWTRAYVDPNLW
jgi:hypothetical protein